MFRTLEQALDTIRVLRPVLGELRKRDAKLADQVRRAASSITLNLGEGSRRRGRDRHYHYTVASGSAEEVRVAIRTAEAWGDLRSDRAGEVLDSLDTLQRMLHGLMRRP